MAAIAPVSSTQQKPIEPARVVRIGRLLRRRPAFALGLAIVLVFLIAATIGPSLTLYDPNKTHPAETLEPPSAQYIFGTDKFGRDVLTRIIYATRLDLSIAAAIALSTFAVGSLIGGIAGFYGGW